LKASAGEILKTLETFEGEPRTGKLPMVIDDRLKEVAKDTQSQLSGVLSERAASQWLKDRIMTLMMHWYHKDTPQQILNAMAKDWIDVLDSYPQWAIEKSIIEYNKSNKYKPVPANICMGAEQAMKKYYVLDMQCKRILQAENTPVEQDGDNAAKQRVADLMKETMANLTAAKTYTKGKDNGYEKLN
jgi:hypothetical protein